MSELKEVNIGQFTEIMNSLCRKHEVSTSINKGEYPKETTYKNRQGDILGTKTIHHTRIIYRIDDILL